MSERHNWSVRELRRPTHGRRVLPLAVLGRPEPRFGAVAAAVTSATWASYAF